MRPLIPFPVESDKLDLQTPAHPLGFPADRYSWLYLDMIFRLTEQLAFPNPQLAMRGEHNGLLAVEGDLSVPRLLLAYRSGIFPWSVNPITWWSPDPRALFELDAFHVSHSLARTLRRGVFEITVNRAFREVMIACSRPDCENRWISEEFIEAYCALHTQGHAHSLECWRDGELAGGIYGVGIGGVFAGESMFHRQTDASKVALFHLIQRLKERGYALFDIQMLTPITQQLGATEIPRRDYLRRLKAAVAQTCRFV
ncbi:MAG: leucyl/phenylalanyl-tRNA--protein transferase [Verrucomicrobiota bacterium]